MFCQNCGKEILDDMNICPFCNYEVVQDKKKQKRKAKSNNRRNNSPSQSSVVFSIIFALLGCVVFVKGFGSINNSKQEYNKYLNEINYSQALATEFEQKTEEVPVQNQTVTVTRVQQQTPIITSEKNQSSVTTSEPTVSTSSGEKLGQKNAVAKAKSYLSFSAFSYTGLIEQLEFEGFSNEEATYAVNKCNVNWNEQAAKKAKSYMKFSSFSRSGLLEQLEYEGFTSEQAEYGVRAVGY